MKITTTSRGFELIEFEDVNGELACLCGPTSKMFDRKAPDHPLQPEERRVVEAKP